MAMRNQWTVNNQIMRNNSSLLILNDYLYLLIDSGRRFLNIIVIPAVYLFLSSCRCFLNVIRVYVDFSNTCVKVPIDSSLQYTITFSPRDWVIVLVQKTPFLCFPLVAIVYPLLIRPHWECDPLLEDRNPDSSMRWTREHIPFWVDQFLYAFSLRSQFSVYYMAVKASLNTHQGSFHPSIYRVQETESDYHPLRIWMALLPESQNHFSPLSVRHRESCVLRFDYYDAMFRREMIEIHNKHEDRTSFLIETRWLSHKPLLCQSKSNGNPSVIKRTVVSPWYSHMYAFVIICL